MCEQFSSDLMILEMEIKNDSITSSKSNQLRNINTKRWKSKDITTQPGKLKAKLKQQSILISC